MAAEMIDKVLNALIVPVILLFVVWKLWEPLSRLGNWVKGFFKGKDDVDGEGFGGIEYE